MDWGEECCLNIFLGKGERGKGKGEECWTPGGCDVGEAGMDGPQRQETEELVESRDRTEKWAEPRARDAGGAME